MRPNALLALFVFTLQVVSLTAFTPPQEATHTHTRECMLTRRHTRIRLCARAHPASRTRRQRSNAEYFAKLWLNELIPASELPGGRFFFWQDC